MPEETTIIRRTVEHGFRTTSGGSGDSGASKVMAVTAIREQRDNEKAELARLNDRFAAYIQRVKFLESQNKQLQADLDELRGRWGLDADRIKRDYEPMLQDARDKLDAITSDKARAEIIAKRAEYDAQTYKQLCDDLGQWQAADKVKIDSLEHMLRENEGELVVLHSQIEDAESDVVKQRNELDRLYDELQRLLHELDEETLQRVQIENEKQTLEEQIPFMNAVHEQEISELKSLCTGSHIEPTAFYRAELQRAIKEIRSDFEALSGAQRRELEEYYRVKTEECRRIEEEQRQKPHVGGTAESELVSLRNQVTENRRDLVELQQECTNMTGILSQLESDLEHIRRSNTNSVDEREREIAELRMRLNQLMASYDDILANKTSLEFEINTYRRLLEGEEAHVQKSNLLSNSAGEAMTKTTRSYEYRREGADVGTSKSSISRSGVATNGMEQGSAGGSSGGRITQTEMQAKTTYQRNAKGPVSISECSPDGKYIILDNTSKNKDIELTGWRLYRKVDNSPEINYQFPSGFRLSSSRNVKIWARTAGASTHMSSNDLVNNAVENWGVGVNVVTRLYNSESEEKATHLQRTVYA